MGYHAWRGKPSGGGGEGRDPHSDNRSGGNRSGIAPTAAPLKPQAGVLRDSGLYTDPGRALLSLFERGPFLCVLSSLRGISGGASMTTPGAAGTRYVTDSSNPPVLGAPASIIGSELPSRTGLRPFALPGAYGASAFIMSLAAPLPGCLTCPARPSLCAPTTLRGAVGSASMTTPGAAGTHYVTDSNKPPVLGAPALS